VRATFKAISDLLPEPLLLVSRDGMVVSANAAAAEHFRTAASVLAGRPIAEFLAAGSDLQSYLSRCIRSTAPHAGALLDARGQRVDCEGARLPGPESLVVLRISRGDRRTRFTLLSEKIDELNREILQRREAESQRERLIEELARAVRLSELFVAVLGHDLRNPLSAVVAGSALALRRVDDPQTRAQLERVLRSGRRMSRMVDQLLDVTRVRLGRGLALARAPMDLCELVHQSVAEMEPVGPADRFEVRVEGECLGEWDRDRLAQVLSNLLANAAQHSLPGSPITVTVGGSESEATVAVHNTGTPIAPDMLPHLFDAFAGGSASTGLGLGLYIAREIVVAHGGRIDVESSAERGTVFTITLPRAATRASGTETVDGEAEGEGLVHEDAGPRAAVP
jgi:signal transduction histidine kinase